MSRKGSTVASPWAWGPVIGSVKRSRRGSGA